MSRRWSRNGSILGRSPAKNTTSRRSSPLKIGGTPCRINDLRVFRRTLARRLGLSFTAQAVALFRHPDEHLVHPRAAGPGRATDSSRGVSRPHPPISRRHFSRGAALLRRRPNQSLRQRGRRQLDPSRRGEGAAEGTGGRWYLCRQRRLGVFRWYSRAWWRVSVRINAPAARGGLRTVATAAKCHRAPVDYHPVAGQMPTGLQ